MNINNLKQTNFNAKNNSVTFNGNFVDKLPKNYLKELDVYGNLSGKELRALKRFVKFVRNVFGNTAKAITPKDDIYNFELCHTVDMSDKELILNFTPGLKSKKRGLRSACLSYVDLQTIRSNTLASEKFGIMAHFPRRIQQRINKIYTDIEVTKAVTQKQNDIKLREKLLNKN